MVWSSLCGGFGPGVDRVLAEGCVMAMECIVRFGDFSRPWWRCQASGDPTMLAVRVAVSSDVVVSRGNGLKQSSIGQFGLKSMYRKERLLMLQLVFKWSPRVAHDE